MSRPTNTTAAINEAHRKRSLNRLSLNVVGVRLFMYVPGVKNHWWKWNPCIDALTRRHALPAMESRMQKTAVCRFAWMCDNSCVRRASCRWLGLGPSCDFFPFFMRFVLAEHIDIMLSSGDDSTSYAPYSALEGPYGQKYARATLISPKGRSCQF